MTSGSRRAPNDLRQRQLGGRGRPIVAALAEQARHGGPAYGGDALTKAVEARFCEIFERDVAVFFVGTGTAANALRHRQFLPAGRHRLRPFAGAHPCRRGERARIPRRRRQGRRSRRGGRQADAGGALRTPLPAIPNAASITASRLPSAFPRRPNSGRPMRRTRSRRSARWRRTAGLRFTWTARASPAR